MYSTELAITVGRRTFSDQNISVRPNLGHVANSNIDGGSDFQHDRTVSKMELVTFPHAKSSAFPAH